MNSLPHILVFVKVRLLKHRLPSRLVLPCGRGGAGRSTTMAGGVGCGGSPTNLVRRGLGGAFHLPARPWGGAKGASPPYPPPPN